MTRLRPHRQLPWLTGILTGASLLTAQDPSAAAKILEARCLACHGSQQMGGLDLRTRPAALRGGSRGPAILPGNSAGSLLFRHVSGQAEPKMPPRRESLPASEIAVLRDWIQSGAPWKTEGVAAPSWWSFRKVERAAVPVGETNPVDAFISTELRAKNLAAAPPADKTTLIRRAYFDLIGLPPPPARISSFLADESPGAFAKVIDELLQSPHYGERWGRHWLDVVRYADSGGYETDILFRSAWRYRDYVVQSFNSDKPYDRFVQEQLAGDEIWPDNLDMDGTYELPKQKVRNLEARIGTGLFGFGPEVHESNMDARKLQYEKLTDWVDTASSAFLGLTFGCARCHDHKFDPITQRDYHRLQAVFALSTEVEIPVVHRMSIRDHGQYYPRVIAVSEARIAYRLHEQKVKKLTKEEKREPAKEEQAETDRLLREIGKAVIAAPEKDAQGNLWDGLMDIPTATVLGHREPELVPPTYIYHRGELSSAREKVSPGLPAFLGGGDIDADCSGRCIPLARKQLALWLTGPEHPLTSRVMVNRIWAWHFGRGLVATPNDFGRQGQAPTHPQLLDWLASEFVERKWSIKAMHRLIMTSQTYQRASRFASAANTKIDPENRYLWKANRRRLEGELLWDSMHSAAGTLNTRTGGKPVATPLAADEVSGFASPWQWPVNGDPAEHHRRGLYLLVRRTFPFPMFEAFDAPVNAVSCPQRDVSSVAPQALWFLNNHVAHEQAAAFAARLRKEAGTQPPQWVDAAWRLALGRAPTAEEASEGIRLVESLSLEKFCLSLFNLNEFAFVD